MAATDPVGYQVDDLYVDLGRQRVSRDGRELPLSALSFDLLLALARAAPNLLTFDRLMQEVWPGLVVSPETVSQRVKLVREALGDDAHAPRYIVGVRGRGYRMLARVTPVLQRPATADAAVPAAASDTVAGSREAAVPAASDAAAGSREAAVPTDATVATPSLAPVATGTPPATSTSVEHAATSTSIAARAAPEAGHSRVQRDRLAYVAAAVIVLVAGVVGWRAYTAAPNAGAGPAPTPRDDRGSSAMVRVERPRQTIAVLPLMDMSAAGAGAYVGDGLAEELGYRLAQVPGLRVAARSSAFAFGHKPADVREVGRLLGVRHVLEGSVRRDGNRLRVTAQLVDTDTGYNVWSQSYDRTWNDVLAIQEEVARSIVEALQIVLTSSDAARLASRATTDPVAFELYLTGLGRLRQPSSTDQLPAAERAFRDALAVDPQFARAHAGLCETYTLGYERTKTPDAAARAQRACDEALKFDGNALEVQRALGRLQIAMGRGDEAIATFLAAIRRQPDGADAYVGLARAYDVAGRAADADQAYRRAIELEPTYWSPYHQYGRFLLNRGRSSDAAAQFRRVVELAPNNASALNSLGAALQMSGDLPGAAAAFERSLGLQPNQFGYSSAGTTYYYLGRYADAVTMFRRAAGLAPDDHTYWGNLADALDATTGGTAEARATYERAAKLAERALAVNASSAVDRAQLAYYYAALGQQRRADQSLRQALGAQPDSLWVQYYASRVAVRRDDRDGAFAALARAVELGYPLAFLRTGPEFAALRDDPRFAMIAGAPPAG